MLGLVLEERAALLLGLLGYRAHDLLGVEVVAPEFTRRGKYVGNVHLRVRVLGEFGGGLCGLPRLFGTVGAQQNPRGKDAPWGTPLFFYPFSRHHDDTSRHL